jgi:hypothetical protein
MLGINRLSREGKGQLLCLYGKGKAMLGIEQDYMPERVFKSM